MRDVCGALEVAVKAAIQAIENGTTPGFTDKEALLAYIGRQRSG